MLPLLPAAAVLSLSTDCCSFRIQLSAVAMCHPLTVYVCTCVLVCLCALASAEIGFSPRRCMWHDDVDDGIAWIGKAVARMVAWWLGYKMHATNYSCRIQLFTVYVRAFVVNLPLFNFIFMILFYFIFCHKKIPTIIITIISPSALRRQHGFFPFIFYVCCCCRCELCGNFPFAAAVC